MTETLASPLLAETLVSLLTTRHAYVLFVLLSSIGLYMLIANENLVKKIIGLNMFQTGVFLFFVTSAYRVGGRAPILEGPVKKFAKLTKKDGLKRRNKFGIGF